MILQIRPVPRVKAARMICQKFSAAPAIEGGGISTDCLLLFLVLCGVVAFLDGVLLALVLAFLGPPVPFGTFLMINMRFGIDPDLPVAATRRLGGLRRRNGFGSFLWSRRSRRRSGWRSCRCRALFRCCLFPVFLCGAGRRGRRRARRCLLSVDKRSRGKCGGGQ